MNTTIAPQEQAILQEKDCVSVDDSSLSATQVLEEQAEGTDQEDPRLRLFVP